MSYYQPPPGPQWSAPQPVTAEPSAKKRVHQRGWVRGTAIGIAAFFLGTVVGVSGNDPTASPQYDKLEQSRDRWQVKAVSTGDDLATAQSELATVDEQTAAAKEATDVAAKAAADAQAMKVAATAAKKKADKRLSKLSAREASLDAREVDIENQEASQPAAVADDGDYSGDSGGGTDPQFGTCGEANDNGYGPYTSGIDTEYDWYDDRDSDGIVCEF